MRKMRNVIFGLGYTGNLLTCIMAFAITAFCSYWVLAYAWDKEYTMCITSVILAAFHAFVGRYTIEWLQNPKRENAFVFLFYWILSLIISFFGLFIKALMEFDFIGAQ